MKRIGMMLFVFVCLYTLLPGQSIAQPYSNSISANPIGLAFGVLNATYENKLSPTNSFTIFGLYYGYTDWAAFGVGGSYRWYLDINEGKRPIEGLSVGPMAEFGFWSWSGPSYITNDGGASFAIGGEVAYKWVFNKFVVEPIVRLSIPVVKIHGLTYHSFGGGVNLGYAW